MLFEEIIFNYSTKIFKKLYNIKLKININLMERQD